jgi:N-acetylglucosamine-6-phosphate deacetylase
MIISAPRLFIDGAFTGPGAVAVEDGVIAGVTLGAAPGADVVLESGVLTPGLIDLHNNGAFGVDFCAASPADWVFCLGELAARGVTSVLPTVITAPLAEIFGAAGRVRDAMGVHPGVLGLHLEGPFLAAKKRGAHRAEWLLAPEAPIVEALLADPAIAEVLRVVTLAPELPGALAAIRRLVAAGVVVSLGHTEATGDEIRQAAGAGASMVTHVFNAQSPLAHRAPGAPGVALTDARLWPCLIADGVHVDPAILLLAFCGCPRAIAVTDSILLAGLPPGGGEGFCLAMMGWGGGRMGRLPAGGLCWMRACGS